jgi:hypothetical protein
MEAIFRRAEGSGSEQHQGLGVFLSGKREEENGAEEYGEKHAEGRNPEISEMQVVRHVVPLGADFHGPLAVAEGKLPEYLEVFRQYDGVSRILQTRFPKASVCCRGARRIKTNSAGGGGGPMGLSCRGDDRREHVVGRENTSHEAEKFSRFRVVVSMTTVPKNRFQAENQELFRRVPFGGKRPETARRSPSQARSRAPCTVGIVR